MKNKGRNLRMFVFINLFGIVLLSLSSYLLVFFQTSRAATGDPPESFHGSYTEGVPFGAVMLCIKPFLVRIRLFIVMITY